MGLKVETRPTPNETRWYVPGYGGNRDDPNPTRVLIRNPTEAEKRRFFADVPLDHEKKLAKIDPNARWAQDAVVTCVLKIETYEDGRGEPITTGEELWEHGHTGVVFEVASEIATAASLTEETRKKSGEPSDSTPAGTQPSTGDVANAGEKGSTINEGASPADAPSPTGSSTPRSDRSSSDAPRPG